MKKVTGPDGNLYDATEVDVVDSNERWSEYRLSDGSLVKVKPVLTSIVRVDGEFDPLGNPVYVIAAQPVVAVTPTDDLKRKP